jgi:hypothetical protein
MGPAMLNLGLTFPRTELAAVLRESLKNDDQLIIRVSGRPAPAAMLQAMVQSRGAKVWSGRRLRFEHSDGLTENLLPALKGMGIIVVQNPSHLETENMVPGFGNLVIHYGLQPLRCFSQLGFPWLSAQTQMERRRIHTSTSSSL